MTKVRSPRAELERARRTLLRTTNSRDLQAAYEEHLREKHLGMPGRYRHDCFVCLAHHRRSLRTHA